MTENNQTLLSIRNLSVSFSSDEGLVRAVNDVSYDIPRGKTLAVVGESGCGKSVTALSTLGLIPDPPGKIDSGQIIFDGQDLIKADEKQMQAIRGNQIAMIFQEPMTSLNPVYTIGDQIVEAVEPRGGHEKVPSPVADHAFDVAFIVALPRTTKLVVEQIMRLKLGKDPGAFPLPIAANLGNSD